MDSRLDITGLGALKNCGRKTISVIDDAALLIWT